MADQRARLTIASYGSGMALNHPGASHMSLTPNIGILKNHPICYTFSKSMFMFLFGVFLSERLVNVVKHVNLV